MVKMKLSEIVFDKKIYPRAKEHEDKVDEYVDAMKGGQKFDPIIAHTPTKILMDGYHRYLALKELEVEEDDIILDPEPEIEDLDREWYKLKLRSAWYNSKHGIQLSYVEKKDVIRDVARADIKKDYTTDYLANQIGVSQQTISNWVKDIREEQDRERENLIYSFLFGKFTDKEIGEIVGLTEQRINQLKNLNFTKFSKILVSLSKKGFSVDAIKNRIGCKSDALVWATLFDSEDDETRMRKFGVNPNPFNIWSFQNRDERLGIKHLMNIPGQIVMNVLYYFTELGDFVVDPMAGGGTTIDTCLVMGRRWRAYDIDPVRDDILKWDIRNGYPEQCKDANLIFLDPPYYDMVEGKMWKNLREFYEFMEKLANDTCNALKEDEKPEKNGIACLVMADRTKGEYDCLTNECYNIFKNAGFKCIQRISAPLTTQSGNPAEVETAIQKKKLLGRNRNIYIFRKEKNDKKINK